ncbi:MAG: hypothetical protein FJZ47_16410 [Candidatus Tectomicrobia bacterium]|uniref:Tyr recombinase domain-containing protein n=1 Tax=Tectimicrobiota bacterium TaxID=2528274 RepID=A0A937W368_UNCTE|nr:hypothetical protein [Candidatus Tectomicrobia bacterium]
MEKIGPKSLARQVHEQRRVAVKVEGFCLTQAREQQRREQSVLFRDVARRYLVWSQENRPRSYTFRQTALKHLMTTFGTKPLGDITRTNMEASQNQRRQDGVRPSTINRERSVLSHLFTKAQTWGLVQSTPGIGTDRLQESNERPRPLSQAEEACLFAVIPTHSKPVVTLALHTGLRLGELRAQTWRDVDLATSTLRVTQPKSKQHEVLPLNSTAFAMLAALPQDDPWLFPRLPRKLSDLFIR